MQTDQKIKYDYSLYLGESNLQHNNFDCGVFMLKGIHHRALGFQKPLFTYKDIGYFRKLI